MAAGKLGSAFPLGATYTTVYTVTAPIAAATFNINIVNTTTQVVTVRLAIAPTGTPDDTDWLEFDVKLEPGGVLERTSLAASVGERVIVWSSIEGVAVRVYGFEQ